MILKTNFHPEWEWEHPYSKNLPIRQLKKVTLITKPWKEWLDLKKGKHFGKHDLNSLATISDDGKASRAARRCNSVHNFSSIRLAKKQIIQIPTVQIYIPNNMIRLNTQIAQSLILSAPFWLESIRRRSSLHLASSLVQHTQFRLRVYCLQGKESLRSSEDRTQTA